MLVSPGQGGYSIKQLTSMAEQGNVVAQFYLGMSYHIGLNTDADPSSAVFWWTKAAEQNNTEAQFLLGQLYYFGSSVEKDTDEAIELFKKAALNGHTQAQINLAALLIAGDEIAKDSALARVCLEEAATKGDSAEAACALARLYEDGVGGEKDYRQAHKWFLRALEIDDTNGDAAYSIGLMIKQSRLPGTASIEAPAWLERAAKQDHVLANFLLGDMYFEGSVVLQNYSKAVSYFKKASREEHPVAQFRLGLIYAQGLAGTKDSEKALRFFTRAADNDLPEAIYTLAMLYRDGRDTEKSPQKALALFEKLAGLGNLDAFFLIGNLFEDEFKDPAKAVEAYRRAAEKGHSKSQYQLALLLKTGSEEIRDLEASKSWFEVCAENDARLAGAAKQELGQ